MNRSDLMKEIETKLNLRSKDAKTAVDTVFSSIEKSLSNGVRVEVRGFGSFGLKERDARQGRNPKSGIDVSVPAKRVMFFKAGKRMRERVDG